MSTPEQRNQVVMDAINRTFNAPQTNAVSAQDWLSSLSQQQPQMPVSPYVSGYQQLNLGPNIRPMFQGFQQKE